MKKLLLTLLSGLSVMSATANIIGPYADANIGINTSWSTLGLNANAGYMFNKYLGVEGGFTYSPGYSYNWGSGTYSTSYFMFDAAAKGVLQLNNEFALFGKLGLGFNNYNSWDGCSGYNCSGPSYYGSNVGLLFGIGGQYSISKNLALQLQDYTVTGSNPNFFMFGVQYKF